MNLWAVSVYFNPCRFAARFSNYHYFRRQLGVPLLTVEWAEDGVYELSDHDADKLVRLHGGDLMWQKERLLTIATSHLPDDCDAILLIDADILLLEQGWPERLAEQLQHHPVVQPFREVHHLPPLPQDVLYTPLLKASLLDHPCFYLARQSFADFCLHGARPTAPPTARLECALKQQLEIQRLAARPSFGHAWAVRRDWLERVGLYEHCVAGSGDLAFAMAITGRAEEYCRSYPLNGAQQAHYLQWATVAREHCGPDHLGRLDDVALHLFHGHLNRRRYRTRLEVLSASGFDPANDLTAEANGPFSWARPGRSTGHLRPFFEAYFQNRAEDEDRSPSIA